MQCRRPSPAVSRDQAQAQADAVHALGGRATLATGQVNPGDLTTLAGLSGALWWGDEDTASAYAQALSQRAGPILPLITGLPDQDGRCERGVPMHRSPEMLHIWLVDHPRGPFSTSMYLEPKLMMKLLEKREARWAAEAEAGD